jgi:hypothetical protein
MHDATKIYLDSTGLTNTSATDVQNAFVDLEGASAGGGAPTTVDYLVGTASAGLSAEIVVGTTPGGELGGTWASPTVDTTHSGSAHHAQDHATRHASGGADAVKLDDLGAPDDNTDLNASTSKHGLLPKLGGGTTNFLRADGTWAAPAGGGGSLTVEEVDGSPTDSAVTKLIFPNGTLSIASHEATYTPAGGGGGGGTSGDPLDEALDPTYGTELGGASLDALLTRLNVPVDSEEFDANGVKTPVDFSTIPSGGFGYHETPATMPGLMELVWKGAFLAGDQDDMGAGPFMVTSAGAGLGAAVQGGDFSLRVMSSGAFSGTESKLAGRGARAATQGAKHMIYLARAAADGMTVYAAKYSMDGRKWSDQVGLIDSTAVTRIGYGVVRHSAGGVGRQLMGYRLNPMARALGNNLCRVPTSGTVTATASSSYSGFSPAAAFDGNTGTDWASNGYAAGQWIQAAFSVNQTGNLVILVPRTSDTWGYGYIEFSSGLRVPTGFIATPNTRNHICIIPLPSAETTSYLKVVSISGGGTNPGFREIQFFNAT